MDTHATLRAAGVTVREAEVLGLLADRLTNAEIAEAMVISVRTVESHVSALLRKLDQPDRLALARYAGALGRTSTRWLAPEVRNEVGDVPLVGRDVELAELLDLGARSREHTTRRLVLVTGPAGVGKTRLAAEAALALHEAGAEVVHGRCAPDSLMSYEAMAEAVRPLVVGRADPFSVRPDAGTDAAHARHQLFEAVDGLLADRPAPLVLVLEDLHWTDASGVQLLRHLIRHRDRSALLVIATCRPEGTEPTHPLAPALDQAHAVGALVTLPLDGLTREAAQTLASHLGQQDAEVSRIAWQRAGGNPFFFTELLRRPPNEVALPDSVRDAIVRRVAGLGPETFDALTAAAVVGEAFRVDDVVDATGAGIDRALDATDRAFAAALVVPDPSRQGGQRFAHGIIREALLMVLSPDRRARLHLALAEGLEANRPDAVTDIARHRHAALPGGDPDLARESALTAYDNAMDRVAYEVAAAFAGMALDATPEGGPATPEILVRRGDAHLRAGDLERASADLAAGYRLAQAAGDPELAARAALGWADASAVWGRDPDLRGALETVLARGVVDDSIRPRIKAKLAQLMYFGSDPAQRRDLGRDAIADARESGRDDVLAAVLQATHAATWGPVGIDERIAMATEAVDLAVAAHRPELEMDGLGWLAIDLLESGDLESATRAFARHSGLARVMRHRRGLRDAELWSAALDLLAGRFDAAAGHVDRARDLGEAAGDPAAETIYWVQRYWLAVERGDPEELDELVVPCQILCAGGDVPAWWAALALLHARRGDDAAARAAFEELATDGFRAIPSDVVWLNAMTYLAEVCAFLDDRERAVLLYDALLPYADRMALIDRSLACKGSVERFLGLLAATLGRSDEAEERLGRALGRHEELRAGPLVERTRADLVRLPTRPTTG